MLVKKKRFWFVTIALIACISGNMTSQADEKRAFENYQAVMAGKKQFDKLSVEEQAEIMMIYRILKPSTVPSDASDDCKDAWRDAESAGNDLGSYAKRLMTCAESGNLKDDCSSEFRRVRSAHSDYESYSSQVGIDHLWRPQNSAAF